MLFKEIALYIQTKYNTTRLLNEGLVAIIMRLENIDS